MGCGGFIEVGGKRIMAACKTCVISHKDVKMFNEELEKFIADKFGISIVDVKFSTCQAGDDIVYSALVLYNNYM